MDPADPVATISTTKEARAARSGVKALAAVLFITAACVGTWAGAQANAPTVSRSSDPPSSAGEPVGSVERRELEESVVVRGTVAAVGAIEVVATPGAEAEPVISGVPVRPGDQVDAGSVVLEVAGRPVIALEGTTPAYRDLAPGSEGADVAQLQIALGDAGFPVDGESGVYGPATASAVAALYRARGYRPPAATAEASAELRAATAELESARAAAEPERASNTLAVLEAELARDDAIRQLEGAEAAAADQIRLARNERDAARRALERGAETPAEREALQAEWDRAETAARQAERDGAQAVASAADQVTLAVARLDDVLQQGDDSTASQTALSKAEAHHAAALEAAGTPLPRRELVVVPVLPTVATEVVVDVGDTASGESPSVILSASTIGIIIAVAPETAQLLTPGLVATVTDERLGTSLPAAISGVVDAVRSGGGDDQVSLLVSPRTPLDHELLGRDLRVAIQLRGSGGAVLAVPFSAIRSGPDGETYVRVREGDDEQRTSVATGLLADGWVEIVDSDPRLQPGDRVVLTGPPSED